MAVSHAAGGLTVEEVGRLAQQLRKVHADYKLTLLVVEFPKHIVREYRVGVPVLLKRPGKRKQRQ